ncbi:monolignol oxidoreductase AtBBE-like 15 [Rutidosis leptorrhynchoides]|uniref:monolignol oxidoreductase AtBBE-like 15 n=1 Tax=Rutidosis leptorrhynchoides TaxID=125765 RepID=UPI003A9A0300
MELNISIKFITCLLLVLMLLFTSTYSATQQDKILQCLSQTSNGTNSNEVFPQSNTQYSSILESTIVNLRFSTNTPKPIVIITPLSYSHVQSAVLCAKKAGFRIRIRSGGHDYAGLSYTSSYNVPFVVIDIKQLQSVTIDSSKKTAWVESGATIGQLYYWVSQKSQNLGFPAGICPTLGLGGHLSGGGFGTLVRKYGLAADNVIDAKIVDVNGRILDRKSMGEDLFWAIRGGGGGSFGVVVAWKVNLVTVPEKVTVFTVYKTLDQGGSDLFDKWQNIGDKLSEDLFIRVAIQPVTVSNGKTVQVVFNSMFLGTVDKLIKTLKSSFPELGIQEKDCTEMSWIDSILYFANYPKGSYDVLRDRKPETRKYINGKSDYVKQPIPKERLNDVWKWCMEDDRSILIMDPHGGKMSEIEKTKTPYPHRKGYLYNIQYFQYWENIEDSEKHISWMRRIYENMTPYVSKKPRSTYVNYRDLDLGKNENAKNTSYLDAMKWGNRYFGDNFKRLAMVKAKVDPDNFFFFEQSIPPLKL